MLLKFRYKLLAQLCIPNKILLIVMFDSHSFTSTVATHLTSGGINSCAKNFNIKIGANCTGWADVHC